MIVRFAVVNEKMWMKGSSLFCKINMNIGCQAFCDLFEQWTEERPFNSQEREHMGDF